MAEKRRDQGEIFRAEVLLVMLSVASGASNALSFLALGQVFTSVVTGNFVILGINIVYQTGENATRAITALAFFALGLIVASEITTRTDEPSREELWPTGATSVLVLESIIEVASVVIWVATMGRPTALEQSILVALVAMAMGLQSGATRTIRVKSLSTTYLTGTLTWAIGQLNSRTRHESTLRQSFSIVALALGAGGEAWLLTIAKSFAAALPALIVVIATGLASFRWHLHTPKQR